MPHAQITFYEDTGQKVVNPGRHMSGHKADILDMAIMESSPSLATAADDGEIIVWNIESGAHL